MAHSSPIVDADEAHAAAARAKSVYGILGVAIAAAVVASLATAAVLNRNPAGITTAEVKDSGVAGRSIARRDSVAVVILPEEYRAIRPAGVDGTAPAIPPSETWPAQSAGARTSSRTSPPPQRPSRPSPPSRRSGGAG